MFKADMWDVIGQAKAVEMLQRSIEQNRLAHAYLFTGPEHIGKMTLAVNLAQAVNCLEEDRPCGKCPICVRIASGKNADVQVISLAADSTEIGIDQIRQMSHTASLKPYESSCRVFIIDGAEYLSTEASNSLLKTLEEPPPNVLIILLVVQTSDLLLTILSRCQKIELRPVACDVIENALVERWEVERDRARKLSRFCNGAIGWALSALADEQLLEQRSQNLARIIELSASSLNDRFAYAAELAALFSRDRWSAQKMLDLCMVWWRDLLLVKGGSAELIVNFDRAVELDQMASHYSLTQIVDFIQGINAASQQLNQNANPRLVFEVLMLSIPSSGKKRREMERMRKVASS